MVFVYKIHQGKSNQSCRIYPFNKLAGNYIPRLGQRGQKPYPVER